MNNQHGFRTVAGLIIAALIVGVFSMAVYGRGFTGAKFIDECEKKKAELKKQEAKIEDLSDRIKTLRKELSPEYLVGMSDKEVSDKMEYMQSKLQETRDYIERTGADAMSLTYLEFYQNETDFWSEVMTTKILRGTGIVKTKAYKYRQEWLNKSSEDLEQARKNTARIKAEMKQLGCSAKPAGDGGWTAVKRLDKSEIFYHYEWKFSQLSGGNLRVVQKLVDTNKGYYRQFIGTSTEFTLKQLGPEKYKLRRRLQDPETGDSHLETILCTITEKYINCTGQYLGPQGYFFGIRGRQI